MLAYRDSVNNMKIKTLLLTGVFVAAILPAAIAAQVRISDGGDGYPGGEFNAQLLPSGPTFKTFCLESAEYLYEFPGTYNYAISSAAVNGGTTTSDPISLATAWLYDQFLRGTLKDIGGATYSSSSTDENDLQGAIWWLEGETQPSYGYVTVSKNRYVLMAESVLGTTYLNDANGTYGVYVMNLTNPTTGDRRQDLLIRVPDGGLTAAMLGMSLAGLALVARRKES